MIVQGRITVNDRVVKRMPVMVDPDVDKIVVDGEAVKLKNPKLARRVYILMNKPKGVYCTNVAQGVQKRAIDLLPPDFPFRVLSCPPGWMRNRAGLLLLTNDGELTNQLTHPRYGIAKTYLAEVEGYIHEDEIDRLNKGIWTADKPGHAFARCSRPGEDHEPRAGMPAPWR